MDSKYHSEEIRRIYVSMSSSNFERYTDEEIIGLYLLGKITVSQFMNRMKIPASKTDQIDSILFRHTTAIRNELGHSTIETSGMTDDSVWTKEFVLTVGMSKKVCPTRQIAEASFEEFKGQLINLLGDTDTELTCDNLRLDVKPIQVVFDWTKLFL